MKGSNIMNSITIKKMVPKFDTDAICSGVPYKVSQELNEKAYKTMKAINNLDFSNLLGLKE